MNESTNKMPFEPIAMPGMPDLPPMPPISEMPRPTFSRQTTPPVPLSPQTRRALPMDDEKPNPFLLPLGISPEAPPAANAPADDPTPQPVPSGSWFRLSRGKGVVLAGLGSLAAGAFGLNALFPAPEPTGKIQSLAEVKTKATTAAPTPAQVIEERPAETPPALLPSVVLEKHTTPENPVFTGSGDLPKPAPILLVDNQTPIPTPAPLPTPIPLTPTTLPVPGEPKLTVPPMSPPSETRLTVPSLDLEPKKSELPAVSLPGEGQPLPKPVGEWPAPELMKPEPTKLPETKLTDWDKTATPKGAGELPAALPLPNLVEPTKPVEIKPTPIPATPLPMHPQPEVLAPSPLPLPGAGQKLEPKAETLAPSPLPVSGIAPKLEPISPITPVAAKANTDYDVDIHKVRQGDTYQAISEKYYESKIYAAALRAYNDNADVGRSREIQVPPMHVIKKFSGTEPLNPRSGLSDPILPASDVEWGSPGTRKNQKPGDPMWR